MTLLVSLMLALVSVATSFFADTTSSAQTNNASYVKLDPAVRDLYSREILFEAQPRLRFVQFAKIKRDFQAVRGKSIIFTKYNNLSGGGELTEGTDIEKDNLSASEVQISVTEQGKAIQVTELLLQTSFQDVMGNSSRVLANHMAVSIDKMLRDAALSTTNILYGNGLLANAAAFNSETGAAAAFSVATVRSISEQLATNNAPKFQGDYYVCFTHPHALRQLRDDEGWQNANQYNGRRQLYAGEVGMFDGVIFIESTQMPHYPLAADAVAAGWAGITEDDTYAAVAFGENAYAWGIALDAELRDDGVQDFGRKHALAWYGIWGAGILEEDNVFKVLTK